MSMPEPAAAGRLEPVRKSIVVRCGVEAAFDLFTARIGTWWPLRDYSVSQERVRTCAFEGRVGGHVYEVDADGERCTWGTVRAWEPPRRVVFSWHPGRAADTAQEVEVRFVPEGSGARVLIEHRGWDVLGPEAEPTRRGYDQGWEGVLARYVEACTKGES
jgi:uncharacterized protein YndB with AHSA1/START domain